MLQNIRDNSQGTVAKIIVGFIVVMFSLFGVESIISLAGQAGAPIVVNGEDISEQEINMAIARQKNQLAQRFGEQFDESMLDDGMLRGMAINQLIDRKVMLQSALEQNLAYSNAAIDSQIRQTPAFQVAGDFNKDQFLQLLGQSGYTPLGYREALRADAVISQTSIGFAGTDFVTDLEVTRVAKLENQTRDFDVYSLKVADLTDKMEVSAEDIQTYYDANQHNFKTQETVSLEYLELDKNNLTQDIEVTDAEIEQAYKIREEKTVAQERRQAAHIMVLVDDNRNEEQAQARIAEVNEKLAAGESFESLAKTYSDDFASAEQGGDLGLNGKGIFGDVLDNVIFELAVDEVSKAVQTDDGFHIVKLLKVQKEELPALDLIKDEIVAQVKLDKAGQIYIEKSEELANIAFSSEDLQEPAEALGLTIQNTAAFSRSGGAGIGANKDVIAAAFSDELLKDKNSSELIEITDTQAIIVRIKEHAEASVKALADVTDQITRILKNQKAREQVLASGLELLAKKTQGNDKAEGAEVLALTNIKRNESAKVDAQIVAKAFAMAKPLDSAVSVDNLVLPNGDVAVVVLKSVKNIEAEAEESLLGRLEYQKGSSTLQSFQKALKDSAEVERI